MSKKNSIDKGLRGACIGFVAGEEMEKLLPEIDPLPAMQTHRFGLLLLKVLKNLSLKPVAFSFVPIQNFPLSKKIWFFKNEKQMEGVSIKVLGFINLIVFKHFSRFVNLLLNSRYFFHKDFIIVHGVHLPIILYSLILKFFGLKIIVFLTDPPGVILSTDGLVSKFLKFLDRKIVIQLLSKSDLVVSLSPGLSNLIGDKVKTLTVPGIYDSDSHVLFDGRDSKKYFDEFTVLYFGGIEQAYGLEVLLNSLPYLDAHIHVRVFGTGAYAESFRASSLQHSNVFYGGFVGKQQLVDEMKRADLLLNPRPSRSEIAIHSSPSKLFEYAASGLPILTTNLASLNEAMKQSLFIIEDESAIGMATMINIVAGLDNEIRIRRGTDFKNLLEKTYSVNGISQMIKSTLL